MMLLLVVLLGLILRLISVNQSLWLDEATSVLVARDFSFSDIITRFSPGDFHPPLYYFLLKIWTGIFDATEIGARSLSVILGLATIPLVFLIGRKLLNKEAGFIAALFFATAPLHIYYSQEARMYVPATFFASLVVLFFIKILQAAKWSLANAVFLAVSTVLLVYTDYPPIFLILSLAAFLLLFNRIKLVKEPRKWLLFVFISVLFFIPWIPIFISQLTSGISVKSLLPGWWQVLGRTSPKELFLVPVKFAIGRISSYDKVLYGAFVSIPLVLFSLLFLEAAKIWNKTRLLWFWLVGPILLAAIFGLFATGFSYFRLLFTLPAFYLLLAAGSFSLSGKWQRLAVTSVLVVNIIATSIYLFSPRFHREDWRGATSWIEENSKDKNAVTLFVTSGQREAYAYYAKNVASYGPEGLGKEGFDTIWLMRYVQPIFDPDDNLRQKVEGLGYKKVQEKDFNGVVVFRYERGLRN